MTTITAPTLARLAGPSLAERYPDLDAEWDRDRNVLDPSQLSPGSRRRAHWVCRVDPTHRWETFICHRTTNSSGCPFCNPALGGPDAPATAYFVYEPRHRAYKVGVALSTSRRINQYLTRGWKLLEAIDFDRHADARLFEYQLLRAWRLAGPFRQLRPEHLPRKGTTETAIRIPREIIAATREAFTVTAVGGAVDLTPLRTLLDVEFL